MHVHGCICRIIVFQKIIIRFHSCSVSAFMITLSASFFLFLFISLSLESFSSYVPLLLPVPLSLSIRAAWGSGYPAAQSLWQRCSSLLLPKVLAIALSNAFADLNGIYMVMVIVAVEWSNKSAFSKANFVLHFLGLYRLSISNVHTFFSHFHFNPLLLFSFFPLFSRMDRSRSRPARLVRLSLPPRAHSAQHGARL